MPGHDSAMRPWGPPWARGGRPPWARGGRPPWARARRGPRAWVVAAWLLVVQLGGTLLVAPGPHRQDLDWFGVALLVVMSVVPVLAFGRPLAGLVVVGAASAAYLGIGYPLGPVLLGLAVCAVVTAVRGHRIAMWLVLGATLVAAEVVDVVAEGSWPPWSRIAGHATVLAVIGLVAELFGERTKRFAEMRRGYEERSRRHASDERLRLAQELHDVLAHDVSLMNVQASTALHLFDTDPERARGALAAIKEVSHETLQELRATVTALRAEDDDAPLRPAAGLADLDDLAARSTAAGLAITVSRTGEVRPLPARVELAAYRVVQEAITNARRHSGATSATVVVDYGADALDLTVADSGHGRAATSVDGHGLVGMRERVEALGGTLSTGPSPDGHGFAVRARIPSQGKEPG